MADTARQTIAGASLASRLWLNARRIFSIFFWAPVVFFLLALFLLLPWRKIGARAIERRENLVVLVPLFIAMVRPIRRQLISIYLAGAAAIIVWLDLGTIPTVASMAILMGCLVRHYWRQFHVPFAPLRSLSRFRTGLEGQWRTQRESLLLQDAHIAKALPADSPERAKKQLSCLTTLLLCNAFFQFCVRTLRRAQQSQLLLICSLLLLFCTVVVTVLVFAFEYLALFHLNESNFSGEGGSGFLFFLFFSFTTFLTANFGTFGPATGWARLLIGLELACTMLVGVILVFIFTTIIREQEREELKCLTEQLEAEASAVNGIISSEFNISHEQAIARVKESDPKSLEIITFFSN